MKEEGPAMGLERWERASWHRESFPVSGPG